jgi:hypothetical protein
VELPVPTPLEGIPHTFWMRPLGSDTPKIAGKSAVLTDVSAERSNPDGRPKQPMTVYEMVYAFAAEYVDTPGRYDARFRQDFGGGQYFYVPADGEFIRVVIQVR